MSTLFATNRVFKQGPTPRQGDTLILPRAVDFELSNNQAEQSIYFCDRLNQDNYQEIGSWEFFRRLDEDTATDILFYIHGYSSLPEPAAFRRTQELQQLFELTDRSRKVLVIPLIWPCDNDLGLVKDYFDDQKAADASDMSFMRFFEKFFQWLRERIQPGNAPFTKKLHVLTQSMGARVLVGAISRAVYYYQTAGFPQIFSNVFMAAPDIVNEALEFGQSGQHLPGATQNLIIYHAADDWALTASIAANIFGLVASKRLGQKGPENFERIPDNVFAFNCSDFNNTYDRLAGHRYFGALPNQPTQPGLLFRHMQLCIERQQVIIPIGSRTATLEPQLWS
ncbi:MAG: alpha/beta hydrolase [Cyanobacteria bacterium J06598_4]